MITTLDVNQVEGIGLWYRTHTGVGSSRTGELWSKKHRLKKERPRFAECRCGETLVVVDLPDDEPLFTVHEYAAPISGMAGLLDRHGSHSRLR